MLNKTTPFFLLILFSNLFLSNICKANVKENNLLFSENFDDYNANADFSKGNPNCKGLADADLQLRMFTGINGKGNALTMKNTENCIYELPGNLDPRQGTVSLWVSPQNWKVSSDKWQWFFSVEASGFKLMLYKHFVPDMLIFGLKNGKEKTSNAWAIVNDKDWQKGIWHKLDLTWDASSIKLYIDGINHKIYKKTLKNRTPIVRRPWVNFKEKKTFPAPEELKGGKSFIIFGQSQRLKKSKYSDINYETAYDEIKIYDRVLNPKEIKDAYEKHFPAEKTPEQSLITVPKTTNSITIDGKITGSEWADAGVVPVISSLPGVEAKAYYKYDNKNLYIGMHANRACRMLKNYKKHDDKLWEEDSFEIVLSAPNKKDVYHFIINGNGTVFDHKNRKKSWDSQGKCAAFLGKDFWSAELEIPLTSLGGDISGQTWKGVFGATYYTGSETPNYSAWPRAGASYESPVNYGAMCMGESNLTVQLDNIGNVNTGKIDLAVKVVPKGKNSDVLLSAEYQMVNSEKAVKCTENLLTSNWKTTMPSGQQKLNVKCVTRSGKLVFLYDKEVYVSLPLETEFQCYQKHGYIKINIDLSNSGFENLDKIKSTGLSGTVKLLDRNGKVHSQKGFSAQKAISVFKLGLPGDLKTGNYTIKTEVESVNSKLTSDITFPVPDMAPYRAKPGVDHSIPKPWTPIKVSGKTFKVLNREYIFGNSPFPQQALSHGSKLLTTPVNLLCDGKPVSWSNFKISEQLSDVVKFAGNGKAGEISFKWHGELWFDGLYYLELQMIPGKSGGKINSLKLTWDMPEKFAKFVLSPLYNKWENNQIKLMPKPSKPAYSEHLVWLTGHRDGFMWWPESDANWVNPEKEKPIVISRNERKVNVALNIISKPVNLNKTATYKMAFMATPPKNQPKDWRKFHADGWGRLKGQTAQHIGWGSNNNRPFNDDTIGWISMIPRDPKIYRKVIENYKNKGVATFTYGMPAYYYASSPDFKYFGKEWEQRPGLRLDVIKSGVKDFIVKCCGNTGVSDILCWNIENLFKNYPELGGIYWDMGGSCFCDNTEHGHGGIDAFGKHYFSSASLGMRQLLMRVYKIHKKYGKTFFYHNHSKFNPICHDFTDYWYPGEQYANCVGKNIDHFYCEGISLEEYQSEHNGVIKGVGLEFFSQYARAAKLIPSLKHRQKEFRNDPKWAIKTMTPLVLHDVGMTPAYVHMQTVDKLWGIQDSNNFADAEFQGYWTDPGVKSTSPKVLVSVYSWKKPAPYRYVLAVANMGRKEQPAGLVIDQKRLGINNKTGYVDLWKNQPLNSQSLKDTKIEGNTFMLIGIK